MNDKPTWYEGKNKRQRCWHCRARSDRHTSRDAASGPQPGDALLCIRCGEWSVMGDDGRHRKPSDAEFLEIGENLECRAYRAAWLATNGGRASPRRWRS